MTIGITQHRHERQVERLPRILLLAFAGTLGEYPINARD